MKYKNVEEARFLSRPNRFIAKVELFGREETVHVKNTGRCRELLVPGCTVYLARSDNPERKTLYDLIAVKKGELLINMDSQAVNAAAEEWLPESGLFSESAKIRREFTHGESRFDFYIEDKDKKAFLEVKGVTLEKEGVALFPDAPTERGVKHLRHLTRCVEEGFGAYVLFVIQMKGIYKFSPNSEMHPEFAASLREAKEAGVQIIATDCRVEPDSLEIDLPVTVVL